MMHWANWRLKNKIAAAISIMFCFSLIVIGTLVYYKMAKDYEQRTLNLMDTTIRQMNITMDVHMQNIERLSVSILSDPIIQRVLRKPSELGVQEDNNEMNYRMLLLSSPWPYIQGVNIFSEDGRVFNFSRGDDLGSKFYVRDEPWYDLMSSTSAPVLLYMPTGSASASIANPETVFSLIRPINDLDTGKRLAFMKIDLKTELFGSITVNNSQLDQQLKIRYIVLQDRNVMFDSHHRLTGQKLDDAAVQSSNGKSGLMVWDGERYIYSAFESSGTHWKTVSILPYSDSVKESVKIRNLLIGLGISFLIIIAVVSYYLASRMVRPLSKVMVTMKRVEMGDFKVRLYERGNRDEIGQLSRIFNMMLESVDHLIHRVYQAELREKDAQLQALQAQINPHMLFNTLNLMKALCRKREVPDVALMAESLADLFRYCLQDWKRTVTLSEEIGHIRNYMRIQELRFPNKLEFRCHVPETLMRSQVVRLSIQPLVENAVIYGVEQSLDRCKVEVTARHGKIWSEDGQQSIETVVISVMDTGPGIPKARLKRIRRHLAGSGDDLSDAPEKLGIGLMNVQKRLQLLFGTTFGLRIQSASGIGTRVVLTVPYSDYIVDMEGRQNNEYFGSGR
ncbi:sensor histidine kinase [Paenibacillus puerhi]|uniref:sensor histidine kinase n=1 Tax=Paenibacillus puerhi TaxID=2692622 RepID=UPI0013594760|nr:sensor histidine kinase [Paenibacillus puerhi]